MTVDFGETLTVREVLCEDRVRRASDDDGDRDSPGEFHFGFHSLLLCFIGVCRWRNFSGALLNSVDAVQDQIETVLKVLGRLPDDLNLRRHVVTGHHQT